MANSTLMQRIANEVETLISQNPKAVERFREQLKVFNDAWQKYWSDKDNELPILTERPDKSKKDAYEYDRHFKCWLPKDSPKLSPDPTKWELDDKYSCYYGTIAVIYDLEKSKFAPSRLCEGILDNLAFAFMQICISRAWGYDKDMLDTALKWVKADIKKMQEKDGNTQREPLSKNAQIVFDILKDLSPEKALTTPEILDKVANEHGKYWDEKELYDRVFPQLRPWGLNNKPRKGYWIEKQ